MNRTLHFTHVVLYILSHAATSTIPSEMWRNLARLRYRIPMIILIILNALTMADSRGEGAPFVALSGDVYVDETKQYAVVTITPPRFDGNEKLTFTVSVKFETVDGTLVAGKDYVATNGVITFQPDDDLNRVTEIDIPLIDNATLIQPPWDENHFFVRLFDTTSGLEIRGPEEVKVFVSDNELDGCNDPDFVATIFGGTRYIGRSFLAIAPSGLANEAGKIWLSDQGRGLSKLNSDGSLDHGFELQVPDERVDPLLLLPNGDILAVGTDSSGLSDLFEPSSAPSSLLELKSDGRENAAFQRSTNFFAAAALQKSGKIITVGRRTPWVFQDPPPSSYVSRLTPTGAADSEFQAGGAFSAVDLGIGDAITSLAVDPQDRILIGGGFNEFRNFDPSGNIIAQLDCPGIVRLLPDGSVDTTFRPKLQNQFAYVYAMAVDSKGVFVLANSDTGPWFDVSATLVRLTADGTEDPDFHAVQASVLCAIVPYGTGEVLLGDPYSGITQFDAHGTLNAFARIIMRGSTLNGGPHPTFYDAQTLAPSMAIDAAGRVVAFAWPGRYFGVGGRSNVRRFDLSAMARHEFELYGASAAESSGVMHIRIVRTGESGQPATVEFSTADETALAGRDYISTRGRIDFAPLELERVIDVEVIDNNLSDGDRQFRIALTNSSSGYAVPGAAQSSFIIEDDEPGFLPGSLLVRGDGSVSLTCVIPPRAPCGSISLQASADFQQWVTVGTQQVCGGYTVTFDVKSSENIAHQFFRIVRP
jgi:uncharacterized delta-60 repeat protein